VLTIGEVRRSDFPHDVNLMASKLLGLLDKRGQVPRR
jgi:hypothetical protein